MASRIRCLTPLLAAVLLASGCGTIANITAETTQPGSYRAYGPTWCEPFGGVQRSVLGGSALAMAGPVGIAAAVVAVGVDTPLSLVGDVVTLPVVYARIRAESDESKTQPTHTKASPESVDAENQPVDQ